jgi:hypothetical protein
VRVSHFSSFTTFSLALDSRVSLKTAWAGISKGSPRLTTHLRTTGVPWLYPAEINGLAMRNKGAALDKSPIYPYSKYQNASTNISSSFYVPQRIGSAISSSLKSRPPASKPSAGASTSSGPSSIYPSFRSSTSSTPKPPPVPWRTSTHISAITVISSFIAIRKLLPLSGRTCMSRRRRRK